MKRIYLDYSATTPLKQEVLEAMSPYFTDVFGNANSLHAFGRDAVRALDDARDKIAYLIGAKPNEIYFTSGGTEADNWAVYGGVTANKDKGMHFMVSPIEHPAVISTANRLKENGYDLSYLGVNSDGIIDTDLLKNQLKKDTTLVACMFANNEVGTIQPIDKVVEICKNNNTLVFTDAVQAVGSIDIDVKKLGVDMLSFSAHKFYGPKGIGCLYIKNGVKVSPIISGGHQERAKRGGTSNVVLAVGMAKALELAKQNMARANGNIKRVRDVFVKTVLQGLDNAYLNGSVEFRLVNNAHFTFKGVSGEALLYNLDLKGVCASNGSACSSGTVEPSHVLKAIGLSDSDAKSSVRFTFGEEVSESDAIDAAKAVISSVNFLLGR
ncbi:MAG: cysteine desulfurase [Clostridia bacterium]|nr:cysteine desulfurase [Clostridia bacterium]